MCSCSQTQLFHLQIRVDHTRVDLRRAADAMVHSLTSTPVEKDKPLVILCFDEAQILTKTRPSSTNPPCLSSLLADLRRALRIIIDQPIFAIFLSTMGELEQFSPPLPMDPSSRIRSIHRQTFEPIVYTPLDVLAKKIAKKDRLTLMDVASTYHMSHLGRPL